MLDYLNAELYKVFRRRSYTLGFLAAILGGCGLLFFLLKYFAGSTENTFDAVVGVLIQTLIVGVYLVVTICDIVFSDQYKYNTLKNEVSYGLPRVRIYLGKLFSAILTAFVLCALIMVCYLTVGRVLFPEETPAASLLSQLGEALALALPLWLGGLGFFLMLQFSIKGSTAATITYVLVLMVFPGALDLMPVFFPKLQTFAQVVQSWMLTRCFGSGASMARAWLVGMVWFVVSTGIGLVCFQKREIS